MQETDYFGKKKCNRNCTFIRNLVDASKLNMAFFDLAKDDEIIGQLRNSLIIELNGTKVLEKLVISVIDIKMFCILTHFY